ncbi:hypothetical protein X777_13113 [Ooceraea biroi]|uniref:Uncharacterized protein n=1 Tax=Ooceraea biroi TaxID=2015173 RepID=A0A026WYS1_OOCBI|nr:hypothetical protein X777_13113 [Ooceraea biroi]
MKEDQLTRNAKAFYSLVYPISILCASAAVERINDNVDGCRGPPAISRALLTRVHRLTSVYVYPRVNREQLVRRMRQSRAPVSWALN